MADENDLLHSGDADSTVTFAVPASVSDPPEGLWITTAPEDWVSGRLPNQIGEVERCSVTTY